MSTTTDIATGLDPLLLTRILNEGYGPGAWHGPDLKAALADVTPEVAFWRPSPERHSIAEIALHHAYCAHSVRGQLTGATLEPFVLEGSDWFPLPQSGMTWPKIQTVVETEQQRLVATVAESTLDAGERFNLVLGITSHAIYHAGQVQFLKRLNSA